jgi:tellurite resistance protein TerC
MTITPLIWIATLLGLTVIILIDLFIVDHGKTKAFTMRQAAAWVTFYVVLAIAFGAGLLVTSGSEHAGQFFAGYITEYSLSIDNLFIFYVIMARFAVPRGSQHMVLLIGIMIALVMRGMFIAVGAAALTHFDWLFYLFGAFLLWTAFGLLRNKADHAEFKGNPLLRWARRVLPTTEDYHGHRLVVGVSGRRLVTPMLIVMVAIGTTDLLFALDSIPAIFGLTKSSYLVFTANAFALLGLRQLYFLLGGLLERLIYLSKGLSVILAFIGVKLIADALHGEGVSWAPHTPTWVSLVVIAGVMAVTTVASLVKAQRDPSARLAVPAVPDEQEPVSAGATSAHTPR